MRFPAFSLQMRFWDWIVPHLMAHNWTPYLSGTLVMHTFITLDLPCWRTGTEYGKLKAEQLSTTINHCGSQGNYTNCGCCGPSDWTENLKGRKKNRGWMFIVGPLLPFVLSSLNFSKVSVLPVISWTLFSQAWISS